MDNALKYDVHIDVRVGAFGKEFGVGCDVLLCVPLSLRAAPGMLPLESASVGHIFALVDVSFLLEMRGSGDDSDASTAPRLRPMEASIQFQLQHHGAESAPPSSLAPPVLLAPKVKLIAQADSDEERVHTTDARAAGMHASPPSPGVAQSVDAGTPAASSVEGVTLVQHASTHQVEGALPLMCSEVVGWGHGRYSVFANGFTGVTSAPVPVGLPPEVGTWRVRALACSAFHCLALSDAGLLFSWGAGADGALGHGDELPCASPRLVEYFGLINPLVVTAIAANNTAAGAHSIVIAQGLLTEEAEASGDDTTSRSARGTAQVEEEQL
ncbi:hypothetical protein EON66_05495, partial [archaeon]